MNPTTGPHLSESFWSPDGNRGFYTRVERYRQAKPYNLRLPYKAVKSLCTVYKGFPSGAPHHFEKFPGGGPSTYGPYHPVALGVSPNDYLPTRYKDLALSGAWNKYQSRVSESAGWLVTAATWRQAEDMLVLRAAQLRRFVTSMARGRFFDAYEALSFDPRERVSKTTRRKRRASIPPEVEERILKAASHRQRKDMASAYLEFHFGWSPLVGDIFSSTKLLCSTPPSEKVYGVGKVVWNTEKKWIGNNLATYAWGTIRMQNRLVCRLESDLVVTNPNLFLLDRLGLVNPAFLAYDLTPWSFVANWFLNIEEVLAAWSPPAGVTRVNPTTTYFLTCNLAGDGQTFTGATAKAAQRRVSIERKNGFDRPSLALRQFRGFSVRRGLAAISLLIQRLGVSRP